MPPIKLHISPCPNDTFMFDALINGRIDCCGLSFDVEYHDIEQLNAGAIAGRADVSKISCAILPQIAESYKLLESGAALGSGNGPLLVRRKGDAQPLRRIAIPGEHTTAAALMRRLYDNNIEYIPMLFSTIARAVERGEVDGGVLIHEGRFVYQELDLELVADLGLLWEEQISLPLPLGAIVMHKSVDAATRSKFEGLLRRSVEYAMANPAASRDYIKAHAQEMDDAVIDNHVALFVNQFSVELGDVGHLAIEALTTPQEVSL